METTPRFGSATTFSGSQLTLPIEVQYFEAGTSAAVTLYATQNPTSDPWGVIVPPSWFTTDPEPLPQDWSLSAGDADLSYTRAQVTNDAESRYSYGLRIATQ